MEEGMDAPVKYGLMFYKKPHCIGIRERHGGHSKGPQVVGFGGMAVKKTEQELRDIAKQAVAHLEEDGWNLAKLSKWLIAIKAKRGKRA